MTKRLLNERANSLPIAVILLTIMMSLGLAIYALADTQVGSARKEGGRESTFNLSDAALKQQVFLISKNFPGSSANAYPACSQASTSSYCPDNNTLTSNFTNRDYAAGFIWSTAVQDNGGSVGSYYSSAGAAGQPGWDQNGDGKLWVRAQSTVRGQTRTLVSQVKADLVNLPFPRNAVTAGSFATSNNGNKVIVDTNGRNDGRPGDIQLRCADSSSPSCKNYRPGQVSPDTTQVGYTTGAAMGEAEINAMRGIARSNNTYYGTGCPPSLPSGALVFVESGNCSYTGGTANSISAPGLLVINSGTLTLDGNATYYGLVYAHNIQNSTGTIVELQGTSLIVGAIAVDYNGRVVTGSSAQNLEFDPNVFGGVKGYGNAGQTHGTWRELRSGG
jgi:hypothetical protein